MIRTTLATRLAPLVVLFWLVAGAANAQSHICPGGPGEGEVQIGVQNGPGFNGVPVCGRSGVNAGVADQTAEEIAASFAPAPDPMARRLEAAIRMEKMMLEGQIKSAQLQNDPRYKRYHAGGWEHFQDAANAAPGELCTAFFSKKDSYVAITGPGGGSNNAYLTFWSPDVPKPSQATPVRVTLTQTGNDPPQTVMAFNGFDPAQVLGAITLAVPTADALLNNMLDAHHFTVALDGRPVAKVDWTGGHAARDRLRACISRRGASGRG